MPQLEAEIAQPNEALRQRQQIGVATDLLAQRFTISSERGWTVAAEKLTTKRKADNENSGVANSRSRIDEDQLWPVIRCLRC
jgi:hypothetical protein